MFNSGYQIRIAEGVGTGRVIPLTEFEVSLGRAANQTETDWPGRINFFEGTVSRTHAKLVWDKREKVYVILHCSKTNQTQVNNQFIKEHVLSLGDRIVMGKLVLIMERGGKADHMRDETVDVNLGIGQAKSRTVARQTESPLPHESVGGADFFGQNGPFNPEGHRLGKLIIGRELGRGSVGRVYLARHETLNLDRAIKVLSPEATRDPNLLKRFQSEAQIAAALRHPNIIQVLDIVMSDGLCYLVMEYLGSRSLQAVVDETRGSPQPMLRVLRVVDQLLSALDYAHAHGVIHRDVKPANILIDESRDTIALTDFSIAQIKDQLRLTTVGVVLGTLEYMAPELFDGHNADPRADLYAVGVILYELLTGVPPFRGKTNSEIIKAQVLHVPTAPHHLNREVPEALSALILQALNKRPDERYSSAAQMRENLLHVVYRMTNPT